MLKAGFRSLAFMVAFALFMPALHGAGYPNKTIQIINPFPSGAVTDIVARILAPKMSAALGQQVVIINKAGGGGAVGIQAAKDAAPDGYTIFVSLPPIALIPIVNTNSGFTLKPAPCARWRSRPTAG
jgi:tripartite-type tricarboxylate transporter receptor subunit TctC